MFCFFQEKSDLINLFPLIELIFIVNAFVGTLVTLPSIATTPPPCEHVTSHCVPVHRYAPECIL